MTEEKMASLQKEIKVDQPHCQSLFFEKVEELTKKSFEDAGLYEIAKIEMDYSENKEVVSYGYQITQKSIHVFRVTLKFDNIKIWAKSLIKMKIPHSFWEDPSRVGERVKHFHIFQKVFPHMLKRGFIKDMTNHCKDADCYSDSLFHFPYLRRNHIETKNYTWRSPTNILSCPICFHRYHLKVMKTSVIMK